MPTTNFTSLHLFKKMACLDTACKTHTPQQLEQLSSDGGFFTCDAYLCAVFQQGKKGYDVVVWLSSKRVPFTSEVWSHIAGHTFSVPMCQTLCPKNDFHTLGVIGRCAILNMDRDLFRWVVKQTGWDDDFTETLSQLPKEHYRATKFVEWAIDNFQPADEKIV